MRSDEKRKPVQPPSGLAEWIDLGIRYQHAKLGDEMTEQTRLALAGLKTFLVQPASVYAPVLGAEEQE